MMSNESGKKPKLIFNYQRETVDIPLYVSFGLYLCYKIIPIESYLRVTYDLVPVKIDLKPRWVLLLAVLRPSRKHAYIILTPLNPFLYSKTGVCRGIYYFSYFCSKMSRNMKLSEYFYLKILSLWR